MVRHHVVGLAQVLFPFGFGFVFVFGRLAGWELPHSLPPLVLSDLLQPKLILGKRNDDLVKVSHCRRSNDLRRKIFDAPSLTGGAELLDRTFRAIGLARRADGGTKLHNGLIPVSGTRIVHLQLSPQSRFS
jgi:hypothetical protein